MAPHIIRPMRFVLPAVPGPRPPWMLRFGLFLYDWLGARKLLPAAQTINLTNHVVGQPLSRKFQLGFEYSDCWVDDARLVILNAVDAAERGAVVRTRTRVVRAERESVWRLILKNNDRREVVTARVLVNAAGPWAGIVAETVLRLEGKPPLRLVKGSHIVVPKLFDHGRGYIFQNAEKLIVFALPFEEDFTLIGTTNMEFSGALEAVAPSVEEITYLCGSVRTFFREQVAPHRVVWAFAGVRSLYDDGAGRPEDVTRDYQLTVDVHRGGAPLLTVYGGKITTHRRLAEDALDKLVRFLRPRRQWRPTTRLPGGDFQWDQLEEQVMRARSTWPFLDEREAWRLFRGYGTRIARLLGDAKGRADLAPFFGPLSAAEVRYLMQYEWACSADDVLWRRTKLGLKLAHAEKEALAQFMAERAAAM